MKRIAFVGLMMLLLAPLAVLAGEKADKLPEGQATTTVEVSGMTCGGCCVKVETAVGEMDGVIDVKADYKAGLATVTYETEKVDVKQIVATINEKTSFKAKEKTSKETTS